MPAGSTQSASSDGRFGDFADTRNFPARQVLVEIPQVLLKLRDRISLRHVVREFFEVAEPRFPVLPVDNFEPSSYKHSTAHASESAGQYRGCLSRSWQSRQNLRSF